MIPTAVLAGCRLLQQEPVPAYPLITVTYNCETVDIGANIDINPTTLGMVKDLEFLIENTGNDELKLTGDKPGHCQNSCRLN